ncbi:MAG: thymidine kinase [Gemmatimonadaceae bacterium]
MSSLQLTGGWIEVIAGVMFSGKTEELMRRVRRAMIARKRVQVFKSHLDDRYQGVFAVSSHDGRSVDAIPVDSTAQIAARIDPMAHVIAIDEAQFLDDGIVQLASALAQRGRRVIVAGTDTDFRGEPFGAMPQLMAVAEIVDKLHAICVLCGAPACRNQRLTHLRASRLDWSPRRRGRTAEGRRCVRRRGGAMTALDTSFTQVLSSGDRCPGAPRQSTILVAEANNRARRCRMYALSSSWSTARSLRLQAARKLVTPISNVSDRAQLVLYRPAAGAWRESTSR